MATKIAQDRRDLAAGDDEQLQRTEREVVIATRRFIAEDRPASWWYLATTFIILAGALVIAGIAPWWPARLAGSAVGSLLMVRAFIIYHDFMHGAMLRGSLIARIILHLYGYLLLVPARSWRHSHNFHHANVGRVILKQSGSYPLMTTRMWRQATFLERLTYRISRSPLIILCAYPMVFAWSITLEPLIASPCRYFDGAVALLLHGTLLGALWWAGGPSMAIFALILPMCLAGLLGAYLFYVQHNFPGMQVLSPDAWTNHRASLQTSSYLKLGRIMRWFTGNIGYHHVHHLNLAIPFYRLPEAMDAIPELQHPVVTTLRPRDILACLRLKLWDEASGRMVGFRNA